MRRVLTALLCCLLLTTAVSAASSATLIQSATTVASDGTCQVTLTLQLQLEEVPQSLLFPLPSQARNITLNGSPARTSSSGGVRNVDLSGTVHFAGSYTFVIHYDLPDSITADKNGQLVLTLRLLSGFAYPVRNMEFSVTLPGTPEHKPEFVSTYHQESVDSLIRLTTEGSIISGSFLTELKDHESLTMTLTVPEDQFPQPISKLWSLSADDIAMYIFIAAALLYWLVTMRSLPRRRIRRTQCPEGLTPGELGAALTGQGVDFPMLVIAWAQMGYLLIHLDDNGRVLLHRRMDMGNERGDFEVRSFKTLFGKRRTVDATGYHFARLARKLSALVPHARNYYLPGSGNPMILRLLCAGIAVSGGVSMALSFAADTLWQVVLSVLLSALAVLICWQIHNGTASIHLRRRQAFYLALTGSALWLLLGIWAGEWVVAALMLLCQWLAGFAAAYGGRRSEPGRQLMSQVLGLRRHLRSVTQQELQRILRSNPEYYYNLAPCALALGVDKSFARQMGSRKLPQCSYLTTGMDGHLTAREWNQLLRTAAQRMDESSQRSVLEKLLGK